ncbi:nucleoside hydrolase [Frateuria aurantia]|uniref:Inosine-uridine nucleoside N-ribohydrolase n=1 Tax=Frateuria aurantia (strain ATCC 33424 / DSM 6220 / KCTC 2777 / LMG 1558 / NBRC 3245 / NCIMB 13370) TaxID=767434 RepID=H8L6T3_FRAAD|nr:nucleoside hydrolase [Frateuria aurantia]AFC86019.1 Inosine-uridine nucleoside N-ribohydrolase [Frateuria aurantia DSM 6220]
MPRIDVLNTTVKITRPGLLSLLFLVLPLALDAAPAQPRHIIVDTDIGGDIDDAFALVLALHSPRLKLDLVTASYGQTGLKARLLRHLLDDAGRPDIPIAAGPVTPNLDGFALKPWAEASPRPRTPFPDAVDAILQRLRSAPAHSIVLVAIAPLTTIDAVIQRDPETFRRLQKVIVMAGSIAKGYGRAAGTNSPSAMLETNARLAPQALRDLLHSGVPIEMLPLDATEVAVNGSLRTRLFAARPPLGADLQELYREWDAASRYGHTPVAFDVVPVARLLDPSVCKLHAMHLDVSDRGDTRVTPGPADTEVCLSVNAQRVRDLLVDHL